MIDIRKKHWGVPLTAESELLTRAVLCSGEFRASSAIYITSESEFEFRLLDYLNWHMVAHIYRCSRTMPRMYSLWCKTALHMPKCFDNTRSTAGCSGRRRALTSSGVPFGRVR